MSEYDDLLCDAYREDSKRLIEVQTALDAARADLAAANARIDKVLALADEWEHLNDAYRASPRRETQYYIEPEDGAKRIRAALAADTPTTATA